MERFCESDEAAERTSQRFLRALEFERHRMPHDSGDRERQAGCAIQSSLAHSERARAWTTARAPDPFTRSQRGSELLELYGSRRPGRTSEKTDVRKVPDAPTK